MPRGVQRECFMCCPCPIGSCAERIAAARAESPPHLLRVIVFTTLRESVSYILEGLAKHSAVMRVRCAWE